jgi:ABC-type phosphate transport system substrate-binding protein
MKCRSLIGAVSVACACLGTVSAADYVVVVGAKSPVDKLSSEQVQQIFLGKTESFPSGGNAVPIDQADSSPVRGDFDTKALGKSTAQVKAYWSKIVFTGKGHPPKEVSSSADVKGLVSGNPSYIGYIEKSAVDGTVKVVFSE